MRKERILSLSSILHLIVFLIITRSHIVQPFLMVEIPADGLLDALLELERRLPAKLTLQLTGVDGVAQVVAGTVGDVGDEVHVLTFLAT